MAQRKPASIQLTADQWRFIERLFALSRDLMGRYAHTAEDNQATADIMRALEVRLKKRIDEILDRQERIERFIILEKTGQGQSAEAREIRSEINQELNSLEWQLSRQVANLNYLEEQAASYGSMLPLWLVNQIEDVGREIQRLQGRINEKKP